jgi:hypothetical protein
MTATVALFGLVLGVLICAGNTRPLPRTALGVTVVLVSLLLAGTQSFPASLDTLDAKAASPAPCGRTCAPPVAPAAFIPAMNPAINPAVRRRSDMPDRHHLGPAVPAAVADPLVSGTQSRVPFR